MKYEWRKHEKNLYSTVKKTLLVTVPKQNFIMIDGEGDPNQADFSERVGVLFSLAYAIKMNYKKLWADPKNLYDDFTVFPLEGLWDSKNSQDTSDKASYIYTIMIQQPEFITSGMFEKALSMTKKKKPHSLLDEIYFNSIEEGKCVQKLHVGPFENEPATFEKMQLFIEDQKYCRNGHKHREIYLNDARKTPSEKRKTILRFPLA
ncbi:GyrI-like domain-containing protein [Enterococcus sp. AZ103]|uniref:GyrI-like domain-containing protein n=1 Tax=Enterococcus sp. AZ103 TaxID=2774628 RepID=UPI003F221793